jgi:phosphate transport system substrate-binding protein
MKVTKSFLVSLMLVLVAASVSQAQVQLNGAGATFPNVLYQKWFSEYEKITGAKFNYQSIGSGGGIKQITEQTVDFGATDAFLNEDQLKAAKDKQGSDLVHIPTALGAVVAAYNVPGITTNINFTPDVLADVYLGKITKWNDARLQAINPSVKLPDATITVCYRSDGSGTTFIFTDYLSKVSPEWKEKVGSKTSVNFPTGIGGKGNEGVSGLLAQTPNSIGYVELAYAEKNKLEYAIIKNKAGNFIKPSFKAVSAAAATKDIPTDLRVSITNADGKDAYPISGFTWILAYTNQKDAAKGEVLAKFLWWAVHDGQKYNEPLYYGELPKAVMPLVEARIKLITADGKALVK